MHVATANKNLHIMLFFFFLSLNELINTESKLNSKFDQIF